MTGSADIASQRLRNEARHDCARSRTNMSVRWNADTAISWLADVVTHVSCNQRKAWQVRRIIAYPRFLVKKTVAGKGEMYE